MFLYDFCHLAPATGSGQVGGGSFGDKFEGGMVMIFFSFSWFTRKYQGYARVSRVLSIPPLYIVIIISTLDKLDTLAFIHNFSPPAQYEQLYFPSLPKCDIRLILPQYSQ